MNTLISKFFAALLAATMLVAAHQTLAADENEPEQIIAATVDELLSEFTTRRDELKGDKTALYAMVDRITRPHFDFDKISKLVLAQEWKSASEAQREAFAEEFRTLLIRTYATALFQYTGDEQMIVSGSEIKDRRGVKTASVDTEIIRGANPPIPVAYSMIKDDESWQVYNMVIAGVNMVTSYRKTYGTSIRKLGIDGLIDSMRKANGSA